MDIFVLLRNGSVIYEGDQDPRGPQAAKPASVAATGYDALAYAQRGDGYQAWIAAGRPWHDVKGRELDVAGWPIDTGSNTPPAAPSLVGGTVWVVLPAVDSTAQVPFTITESGRYWLAAGEQSDQNWALSLNGTPVGSGNGSSDESAPYDLGTGSGVLSVSFNAAAVSPEVLAQRVAAGEGVSKQHYTLRRA